MPLLTQLDESVNVQVNMPAEQGQDKSIYFKIQKRTQLLEIMEAYCARQNLQMQHIRFLFQGSQLRGTETPDKLEMEDDDVLDVFQVHIGLLIYMYIHVCIYIYIQMYAYV